MKLDKINEINNLPSERLFSSLSKGISKETEDVTITAKKKTSRLKRIFKNLCHKMEYSPIILLY